MGELSSKYTIDMVITGDKARDSLNELNQSLKEIEKTAKKSVGEGLADGMKAAQTATNDAIKVFNKQLKNTSIDFDTVTAQFSKNSQKTLDALEKQYAKLRLEQAKGNTAELEAAIQSNREMRLSLKLAERNAAAIRKQAGVKEHTKALDKETARLNNLKYKYLQNTVRILKKQNEQNKSGGDAEKSRLQTIASSVNLGVNALKIAVKTNKARQEAIKQAKENIKLHKAKLDAMGAEVKGQNLLNKVLDKTHTLLKQSGKAAKSFGKSVAGLGDKAVSFTAGKAIGGAKAAFGAIKNAIASPQAQVVRDRAAARIQGFSLDEARSLIGEIYAKTGADDSQIVEAIQRVRATLGNVSKQDLIGAATIELTYPGAAASLASTDSNKSLETLNAYGNRMRALQKSTGASLEQVQASMQKFSNMRASNFGSATVSELQGVYLALQNSGAFDNEEELERAFRRFVRGQRDSGVNAVEFAKTFDWVAGARGQRNKTQAENVFKNMNWDSLAEASKVNDTGALTQTAAEKNAERMRKLEEKKNEILLKLVETLMPQLDQIAEILGGDSLAKLLKGLLSFVGVVVPVLKKVLDAALPVLGFLFEILAKGVEHWTEKITKAINPDVPLSVSGNARANGGLAYGPTLVGERAFQPELVLPLDYSRNTRAHNIVTNVAQTFNMHGNETTALSLSQAVKSRDFRRATSQSAFLNARGGVL